MAAPSLPGVDWTEVRRAVETGVVTLQQAAEKFGIGFKAVQKRSYREEWLVPKRIIERAKELETKRLSQNVVNTPSALQVASSTLAERQEEHRSIVHRTILKALKAAEKTPPSIESMTDYEKAVKVHRLNLDMTTGDQAQVAVTFWHGEAGGPDASRDVGDVIEAETVEAEAEEVDWV